MVFLSGADSFAAQAISSSFNHIPTACRRTKDVGEESFRAVSVVAVDILVFIISSINRIVEAFGNRKEK